MGKWVCTTDIGTDLKNYRDDQAFFKMRDIVVKKLRKLPVMDAKFEYDGIVDKMAKTKTPKEFNYVLAALYPYADKNGIWLNTIILEQEGSVLLEPAWQ